ncbi:hypothetical protein [Trujillonella endophytica]|uniref:Uncharacterized protein n=1 Tax=Trujillonella endophytica TaxID=673521 RepID=A0A1H8UU35_9ACTN|nr:hypothetical protein [Trujillella endophytica]SEP06681.1 hypothetical protein SAMN05660991_03098 [Trujillella endophytica]
MTHSIDTPFPPPPSTTTGSGAHAPATGGSPSTADVAKGEARNVGQTAAQGAGQVASTAADQAREVAQETKAQAADVLAQGRDQLRQQTLAQQQKAGQGLAGLAEALRGMADGNAPAPGPARDLVQQGAGKVEEFAHFLQNREPADLLEEVRSFARRKPGTFLLGAALAGIVAGRLTSGVKAAHSDSGTGSPGTYRTPTNYVDPAPAYSSYGQTDVYGEPTTGYETTATRGTENYPAENYGTETYGTTPGAPVPPPPYGTVPPAGSVVPPSAPSGWDDPSRRPGGVA